MRASKNPFCNQLTQPFHTSDPEPPSVSTYLSSSWYVNALPSPVSTIHSFITKPYMQTTALKSIRSLAPLLDRVLVQRIKAETKTASGLFLPESSVKELNEAKVLAVGPGGLDKEGKRVAPSVAPGDKVLIPQVCDRRALIVHCTKHLF